MCTLLNKTSDKQIQEQQILEKLHQINISQNNTNDEEIKITKDNQQNYQSIKEITTNEIKLENRIIKKELKNQKLSETYVNDKKLLKEDIIIKNSYDLTLDLFNTIKHINEAEYLLRKHNKLLNKAMQDILHKIESDKFNVVEGYKLAKKIQIIRNEKSLIRENLIIYKQLNCLGVLNKETMSKLEDIINNVEKDVDVTYEPKILKDLTFRYDNDKIYNKYDDIKKEDFINLGIEEF